MLFTTWENTPEWATQLVEQMPDPVAQMVQKHQRLLSLRVHSLNLSHEAQALLKEVEEALEKKVKEITS